MRTNPKRGQKMGLQELYLMETMQQLQAGAVPTAIINTYGVAEAPNDLGNIRQSLLVREASGGAIEILPGKALVKHPGLKHPALIHIRTTTVPTNSSTAGNPPPSNENLNSAVTSWAINATKDVVISHKSSGRLPVRFDVTASTVFTVVTADQSAIDLRQWVRVGSRILLTTGDSSYAANQGVFTVSAVTATAITVDSTYETLAGAVGTTSLATAENECYIRPSSYYFSGYPAGGSAAKEYLDFDSWEISLQTAGYVPSESEIVLATVTWSGSTITTIVDKRQNQLLTFKPTLFRKTAPAAPRNLRFTWGTSTDAPTGRSLLRINDFQVDPVHDYTPTPPWVKVEWGWRGTGQWVSATTFRITALDNSESYAFTSNELVTGGKHFIYVGGVYYEIKANASGTVPSVTIDITVEGGIPSGSSTSFEITPAADWYEVELVPFDADNNEIRDLADSELVTVGSSPTRQSALIRKCSFGVRYGIRVRSAGGFMTETKSAWTAAGSINPAFTEDGGYMIVYIIPAPPVMTQCTFDSVDGGVEITWEPVPGGAAYFGSYTVNGQAASVEVAKITRDANVAVQRAFPLGPTASPGFRIDAPPGTLIRATVWCIDQYGQQSRNAQTNGIEGTTAGGTSVGANEKVLCRSVEVGTWSSGDDTETERMLGRLRLPKAAVITEVAIEVETYTADGTTPSPVGWITVYLDGQAENSINLSFSQTGLATVEANAKIRSGGWLVISSWLPTIFSASNRPPGFTGLVTVVYREGDVRLNAGVDESSVGIDI